MPEKSPPIADVKKFWNDNPLFTGEGKGELGTREWFLGHEQVYFDDCLADKKVFSFIACDLNKNAKILDIGCGPGIWVRFFLRNGYDNIWACDLTSNAVELTQKSLVLFDLKTEGEIVEGNAEALPFENDSFDHINCQGVIHHTPDTEKCVEEFFRVLKPGGTVCFSVYHKNFILNSPLIFRTVQAFFSPFIGLKGRGREKMLKNARNAEDIVRMYDGVNNPIGRAYTLRQVENMAKRAGFRPIAHRHNFFPARALPVKIPHWLHAFLDRYFGLLIMLRCEKPVGK